MNVDCTATGVYSSQERSRDIKIHSYSLNYHGRVLIDNASIELNFGRRYGLIGANGSGKLLSYILLLKEISKSLNILIHTY
ncbi:unnamed protein product [Cunninghamella echinulata]